MTVAIRIGLRARRRRRDGHARDAAARRRRRARRGACRGTTLHHAWAFFLAGLIAPGCSQILFTLSIREAGASRTSVAVATAPLFAVAIALVFLDEPIEVPLVLGALAIVGGGVALVDRERPARAPPDRRPRLRDRRVGAASRCATTSCARCTRTRARRRRRPRRCWPGRSSRSLYARRLPSRGELRGVRAGGDLLRAVVRLPVRGVLPRPGDGRLAARRDGVPVGRRPVGGRARRERADRAAARRRRAARRRSGACVIGVSR